MSTWGPYGPVHRIEIHAGAGDDTVRVSGRVEPPVWIDDILRKSARRTAPDELAMEPDQP